MYGRVNLDLPTTESETKAKNRPRKTAATLIPTRTSTERNAVTYNQANIFKVLREESLVDQALALIGRPTQHFVFFSRTLTSSDKMKQSRKEGPRTVEHDLLTRNLAETDEEKRMREDEEYPRNLAVGKWASIFGKKLLRFTPYELTTRHLTRIIAPLCTRKQARAPLQTQHLWIERYIACANARVVLYRAPSSDPATLHQTTKMGLQAQGESSDSRKWDP